MSRIASDALISTGMNAVINKPELSSAKYEAVTGFIAAVVGGLGVPFYIEATAKAGWKDQASSITTNVLGIMLFTKGSLDYLYGLIQKREYGKAVAVVIGAAVLYSPQVLIAIMESNASLAWTIFAAAATGLSGSFTSAYAVAQIPAMYQSAQAAIAEGFCSQATPPQKMDKENVLANLRLLLDRVRVSNYAEIFKDKDIKTLTRQELLDLAVKLARTAPQPCVENAGSMPSVARGMLGFAFVGLLLFGTLFSYGCATEASVRQDFKLSPMVAFLAQFALLSFQYLLNVTGGFGVARGVVDTLSLPNYKRFLPNEKTVGGAAGLAVSLAAPILGVGASAFSGRPTFEFSQTCDSSAVQPSLSIINRFLTWVMPFMPQDGRAYGHVADYSSRFFNAIFAAKFFYELQKLGVTRFGSTDDKNYLFVKNEIESLIALVEKTPADKVKDLFMPDDLEAVGAAVTRVAAATDDHSRSSASAVVQVVPQDEDDHRSIVSAVDEGMTFNNLSVSRVAFISSFRLWFLPKSNHQEVADSDTSSMATATRLGLSAPLLAAS